MTTSPSVTGPLPAVEVRGLSKRYRIGDLKTSGGLYDRLGSIAHPRRKDPQAVEARTLWALKDVTFTVPPRQVLGVVGRNGSGKSTLMKILARVTSPTEGEALVRGRVGALLQVGMGFHPELSGRDNIGLAAAIMGMSKEEIAAREEAIVEFSEIGRFLDTPVKHYSSGMFVRLAFSVSAHLTSEVLLVDEALSVGDAAFQDKCAKRIRGLVLEGRTVLFVSHSTGNVIDLCDSAVILEGGRLVHQGGTEECMDVYESDILGLVDAVRERKARAASKRAAEAAVQAAMTAVPDVDRDVIASVVSDR
jgi:ABC-type polysaccharide/polyol phosphate transport system ATPase subunit